MIKVAFGGAITNSQSYKKGADTFVNGDIVRITTLGVIALSDIGAVTGGNIHGMALANSADLGANDRCPVALFGPDTILACQIEDGEAQDEYTKGASYAIIGGSGAQKIDQSAATGELLVVGYEADDSWFQSERADETAVAVAGTPVYVYAKIAQANLDGRNAA